MGRCPECGEFDTFEEESAAASVDTEAVEAADVAPDAAGRVPTGLAEFDRVLGGGLVPGSLVLIGGQPGIGKSTLLLQAADSLAEAGRTVMYVCGEESPEQVKLRAERLGAGAPGLLLLPEVDVRRVEASVVAVEPSVLVVDSIQAVCDSSLTGGPGTVGQVRATTSRLQRLAKDRGVTVLIVGHVTKEGSIAGPRVLEHMVDTVLYFEGDRDHVFRVVRAVKNRFGSVSEIGIFEMGGEGLLGVASASEALLSPRDVGVPGSVVTATIEGTRPLLVEIQALVTPSCLDMPRRHGTGIDRNRMLQVIAVLERRCDISFGQHDVYVSAAGGVRIVEPGVDLALALALASARADVAVRSDLAAFGEVGLTGEIRAVPRAEARLSEAGRMGMGAVVMGPPRPQSSEGLDVVVAATVKEAVETVR